MTAMWESKRKVEKYEFTAAYYKKTSTAVNHTVCLDESEDSPSSCTVELSYSISPGTRHTNKKIDPKIPNHGRNVYSRPFIESIEETDEDWNREGTQLTMLLETKRDREAREKSRYPERLQEVRHTPYAVDRNGKEHFHKHPQLLESGRINTNIFITTVFGIPMNYST